MSKIGGGLLRMGIQGDDTLMMKSYLREEKMASWILPVQWNEL